MHHPKSVSEWLLPSRNPTLIALKACKNGRLILLFFIFFCSSWIQYVDLEIKTINGWLCFMNKSYFSSLVRQFKRTGAVFICLYRILLRIGVLPKLLVVRKELSLLPKVITSNTWKAHVRHVFPYFAIFAWCFCIHTIYYLMKFPSCPRPNEHANLFRNIDWALLDFPLDLLILAVLILHCAAIYCTTRFWFYFEKLICYYQYITPNSFSQDLRTQV